MFCRHNDAEVTDQKTYIKTKPSFSKTECSETRQFFLKQSKADSDDVLLLVVNYDKVNIVQQFNKKIKFKVLCVRAKALDETTKINTKSNSSNVKNRVGLGFLIFFVLLLGLTAISCAFKPIKVSFNSCFKMFI